MRAATTISWSMCTSRSRDRGTCVVVMQLNGALDHPKHDVEEGQSKQERDLLAYWDLNGSPVLYNNNCPVGPDYLLGNKEFNGMGELVVSINRLRSWYCYSCSICITRGLRRICRGVLGQYCRLVYYISAHNYSNIRNCMLYIWLIAWG